MDAAIAPYPDKPNLRVGERVQIHGKWYRILSIEPQRIELEAERKAKR